MQLTESQLKSIIRESLLSEMPYEPFPLPTGGPEEPKFPSPDSDPDRKYRREQEKRQLIKRKLKQKAGGFLDSRVTDLRSIGLGQQKYLALGYSVITPTEGKYKRRKMQVAVFLAPKSHLKNIKSRYEGGIISGAVKITNLSGRGLGTFTQHKTSKVKDPKLLMYIPSEPRYIQDINKSNQNAPVHKISFNKELVDIGLASGADWAIEALTVLGAIPGIGNAADAAAVYLAIAKKPPSYLLAAISALCMLPVVGIGAALARPLFKKLTGKGGKQATKEVVDFIKERTGKSLADKKVIKQVRKQSNNLYDRLAESKRIARLTLLANMSADKISAGLAKSKEILDEIVDNLEFVGKASKEGLDDLTKASTRKAAARVLKELSDGSLRDSCARFAKEIAEQLPPMKPPQGIKTLIGRKFIHDKTGKEIVFKSMDDFGDTYINACRQMGIPYNEAAEMFGKFYRNIRNKPLKMTPVQIDKAVDMLTKELKNVKIKIINDKSIAKKSVKDKMVDSNYGFYRINENTIYINSSSFTKGGIEKQIKETIEHEMIHAIDRQMLVILAGGKEAFQALSQRHGYWLASDVLTKTTFRTSRGAPISKYIISEKEIKDIIKKHPKSMDGLTNWQFLHIRNGVSPKSLAYLSEPAEMFVRVQRISYWLKKEGFRRNDWDEFFKLSTKDMIDEVPDADLFITIAKIFDNKSVNPTYSNSYSDLIDLFDSLIGA